jgi:preprotein translocase subunit SecD
MRKGRHLFTLAVVFVLTIVSLLGLTVFNARPKLGLDLRGGLSVILQATGDVEPEVLERTVGIIRDRVDSLGVAEPEISRVGADNIVVQLPDIDDPDRALQIVGKTAQLRFRPVIQRMSAEEAQAEGLALTEADVPDREAVFTGEDGDWFRLAPAAVRGDEVRDAYAQLDPQTNQWMVQLELTPEGRQNFAEVTQQLAPPPGSTAGRPLAIVLDMRVESAPVVQTPITDGRAQISGEFSEAAAKDLALVLRTGALPIELEAQQVQRVSPTLGGASLRAGLLAGAIGIALVALYMLFFYKLLGLVTLIGLTIFGTLIMGFIGALGAWQGFTLTLAGIAGLIVSVGIAADSYIIYFERIKDELAEGKTFRSSVERAYTSAFRTNLAGNSVAFAAAIILYLLAVGPVRGFALTLGISVVFDIAMLAFFTHPVIALLARNKRLAGQRAVGMQEAVSAS